MSTKCRKNHRNSGFSRGLPVHNSTRKFQNVKFAVVNEFASLLFETRVNARGHARKLQKKRLKFDFHAAQMLQNFLENSQKFYGNYHVFMPVVIDDPEFLHKNLHRNCTEIPLKINKNFYQVENCRKLILEIF